MSTASEALAASPPSRPSLGRWAPTLTVMMGMMATIFSSTMVNVAIPDIMGAFGVGQDQAHWMSTGFIAAMTCTMLLNAWFVANLGVRNTFTLAVVVFSVASLYGQVADGFYPVVAARVVQGACAGLLQPLAMTVIFSAFPPEERGKAMGIFGMGVVLGPAIGPTIGGFIVDNAEWRYVFVSALPVMAVAGVLGMRFLPGRAEDAPELKLNWFSFMLVCGAVATLLTGLSNGQRQGWESVYVVRLFLLSITCTALFIFVESRTRNPIVQVKLFANRTFAVSSLVAFMFGAGMFGSIYLMPIFVQTIQGFTATKAGLMLMLAGIILVFVFPVAGRLANKVAPGYPIASGMCLFAISSFVLAGATVDSSFWWLAGWTALGRVGLGFVVPSLNSGALAAVRPDLVPFGAGAMNFIRMLGGALGVNTLAVVLEQRTEQHGVAFKATQTGENPLTQELFRHVYELLGQQGIVAVDATRMAYGYLGRLIAAKANMMAFQDGFIILAVGFVIAAASALLLTKRPQVS